MAEARPLRIAVFGASGQLGQRIAGEALRRGHRVTAVMRNPDRMSLTHPQLRAVRADVTDPLLVATVARGHDAIISAIAPTRDAPEVLAQAATSILQAAKEAGIKRVIRHKAPIHTTRPDWAASIAVADEMFCEAGVEIVEVEEVLGVTFRFNGEMVSV